MKSKLMVVLLTLLIVGIASSQTVSGYVYAITPNSTNIRTPVEGAVVTLQGLRANSATPSISMRTISGHDGSYAFYTLVPLPPGTYVLTATARGYIQISRVVFTVEPTRPGTGYRYNILMAPVRVDPRNGGSN